MEPNSLLGKNNFGSNNASGTISPSRFEEFKSSHRELFYPVEAEKKLYKQQIRLEMQ